MRPYHAAFIAFALSSAAASISAQALKPLTNEPSRQALFDLIKKAEETQNHSDGVEFFNLYGPFRFPNDALYDVVEKKDRADSIFGVDLSHYTPSSFPFASLRKKQVGFAYLKATQGTGYMDGKFATFWQQLGKLPQDQQVHRGAYHFLSAERDAVAQASTFVAFLAKNGGLKPTDMPPVMDLEWDKASLNAPDRWANKTPDQIVVAAKAWLESVEKQTGRKPMIYTSLAWWRERVGPDRLSEFVAYPLWIADYSRTSRALEAIKMPQRTAWTLWQFTDGATMAAGFEGGFDANIFKGSEADFYKNLGVQRFVP
ncbi:glycoside hydrolase family 25 protein [Duganella aceris]|uniref:Lysozyme n=1 Tax=Duganella aceris TaxID=2703883 RepID=A0ABX0FEH2_9BURK|nr:GH25 family lysozyme [Duganella aceris]NGZ82791.1 hypothetical protein [Duganella aceris]